MRVKGGGKVGNGTGISGPKGAELPLLARGENITREGNQRYREKKEALGMEKLDLLPEKRGRTLTRKITRRYSSFRKRERKSEQGKSKRASDEKEKELARRKNAHRKKIASRGLLDKQKEELRAEGLPLLSTPRTGGGPSSTSDRAQKKGGTC